MILFPAIDLLGGQCVRLTKGDYNAVTVYNSSPANQAEQFASAGASWLQVVDLDGAKSGQPVNIEAVRAIRRSARLKIQLGGGIRTIAAVSSGRHSQLGRTSAAPARRAAAITTTTHGSRRAQRRMTNPFAMERSLAGDAGRFRYGVAFAPSAAGPPG